MQRKLFILLATLQVANIYPVSKTKQQNQESFEQAYAKAKMARQKTEIKQEPTIATPCQMSKPTALEIHRNAQRDMNSLFEFILLVSQTIMYTTDKLDVADLYKGKDGYVSRDEYRKKWFSDDYHYVSKSYHIDTPEGKAIIADNILAEQTRQRLAQVKATQQLDDLMFQEIDETIHECTQELIEEEHEYNKFLCHVEGINYVVLYPGAGGAIAGGLGGTIGAIPGIGPVVEGGLIIIAVGPSFIKWLKELIEKKRGGGAGDGNQEKKKKKKNGDDEDKKNKKLPVTQVSGSPEITRKIYENNPKHHKHSRGNISKPPINGQRALDNSIPIGSDGKTYIGIEDGKFVQFQRHHKNIYHGFVIEDFKCLKQEIKNALYEQGWVSNVTSGKIIK